MRYAAGKFALGRCDRCDFPYRLNDLILEWTGSKVCIYCYEPKHPQLKVRRHQADAQALRDGRPGSDDIGKITPWTLHMSRHEVPDPSIIVTPPVTTPPATFEAWDAGVSWDSGTVWQ